MDTGSFLSEIAFAEKCAKEMIELHDARAYLKDVLDISEDDSFALIRGGYRSCRDIISSPQRHLCMFCRFDEVKAAGIYAAAKVIAESE